MVIKGKVWKFGDDIDTDRIAATRYSLDSVEVQAQHCMEGADPEFPKKARPGDIIVAGKNFGCGSSRERAATCVKDFGVAAIVARCFSRIYTRNAINIGLPILECPDALDRINGGDVVEIDLQTGIIRDLTNGQVCKASEFPTFLQSIIEQGGLVNYVRAKLGKEPLPKA